MKHIDALCFNPKREAPSLTSQVKRKMQAAIVWCNPNREPPSLTRIFGESYESAEAKLQSQTGSALSYKGLQDGVVIFRVKVAIPDGNPSPLQAIQTWKGSRHLLMFQSQAGTHPLYKLSIPVEGAGAGLVSIPGGNPSPLQGTCC